MRRFQVGVTEARRDLIVQGAAALGALLLFISLFLPWYSVGLGDSIQALAQAGVEQEIDGTEELGGASLDGATDLLDDSINYSGWSSLEFADALLLFVALAALMLALGRRRGDAAAERREAGDTLLLLGLLAVVTVLVLLFTKNSVLGMLGSTLDFGQDKAGELGQPGAGLELLDISPGIGLWIGLLGSLLTLAAGFFHSLVDPTGAGTQTRTTTSSGAGAYPATEVTTEAPATSEPQSPNPPPPPPPSA